MPAPIPFKPCRSRPCLCRLRVHPHPPGTDGSPDSPGPKPGASGPLTPCCSAGARILVLQFYIPCSLHLLRLQLPAVALAALPSPPAATLHAHPRPVKPGSGSPCPPTQARRVSD